MVSVPLNRVMMMNGQGQVFESYITGEDTFYHVFGASWYAQAFTPAVGHTISRMRLRASKDGAPGLITVSIRASTGSVPTGSDLAVATIDGDAKLKTAKEWHELDFVTPLLLVVSTQMWFIYRAAGADTDNDMQLALDASSPTYAGGTAAVSSDSGAGWAATVTDDILFEDIVL